MVKPWANPITKDPPLSDHPHSYPIQNAIQNAIHILLSPYDLHIYECPNIYFISHKYLFHVCLNMSHRFFIEPHELAHKKQVFPPEIHGIHGTWQPQPQTISAAEVASANTSALRPDHLGRS